MTMQNTPWYKGFHDGFAFDKDKQVFEDEIDQEEYDQGFSEGRTAWFDAAYR